MSYEDPAHKVGYPITMETHLHLRRTEVIRAILNNGKAALENDHWTSVASKVIRSQSNLWDVVEQDVMDVQQLRRYHVNF